MRPRRRGGPTAFAERRERAQRLAATPGVEQPLAVLAAVLDHQQARLTDATVTAAAALVAADAAARAAAHRYPLLDVSAAADAVDTGVQAAVAALADPVALPAPLAAAARGLAAPQLRARAVAAWLHDPTLVEPPLGFWVGTAAQPVLELAVLGVEVPGATDWGGPLCPLCGGAPQVSLIAEESGEFMAGAPRALVCGRCATHWAFPRATCVACGEDDARRLGAWTTAQWPAIRVDACDTCRAYIKTFDLRQPGAGVMVPLVDDVASAALDLWATGQGLQRPVRSLAGV